MFRASLKPDMAYWRRTVKQLGRPLVVSDIVEQVLRTGRVMDPKDTDEVPSGRI